MKQRKIDHIRLSLDNRSQSDYNVFDSYHLPYIALPELDLEQVHTSTTLLKKTISQPLIIASMTGGTKYADTINRNIAIAAENSKVAIGVGSQRIALQDRSAIKTFEMVRQHAPNAIIFANMGAIQLNNSKNYKDYQAVIDMIDADALYLHINPLQEALQPGGDTNYAGLITKIEELISKIKIPVYVKEVGNGMDVQSAQSLIRAGVSGIDVAGVGGTSYSWIEAKRSGSDNLADWFKSVGIGTDEAVKSIAKIKKTTQLVASGGLRSPLDALKSRSMGADYYSMARPILEKAIISSEAIEEFIEEFRRGLQIAMFGCGVQDWQAAKTIVLKKA